MKKIITTLFSIFLISTTVNSQDNFNELWLNVEKFELDDLPKSALKIVDKIYNKAAKENNSPQLIKSLFYKSKFSLTLEENEQLKVINQFKAQIAHQTFPTKNILENILGNLYWQYFKQNRYKFYNRTATKEKTNLKDFRTWDLASIFKEIQFHFDNSLQNDKQLLEIKITDYNDILNIDDETIQFKPSLFDFLANSALKFYNTSENSIHKPSYKFEINNPDFIKNSKIFSSLEIISKDSISNQFHALKLYQKLIQLHTEKNQKNALAHIDIERLKFVESNGTFKNSKAELLKTLQTSKQNNSLHESSGLYAFEIAQIFNEKALHYKDTQKKENHFKNKEALELCNQTILKFPESLAAKKCKVLKANILNSSLNITSEEFIPIQSNSRFLVLYKNLNKLYFSAYKVSESELSSFNDIYDIQKKKNFLSKLSKVKTWISNLKNESDFLQHTTETIVPKFDGGKYLIIASEKRDIETNFIHASTVIQVTDLTLVSNTFNNSYNYQVLDRNTGKPIENAKINLQNTRRNYGSYINKTLVTDKQGFATFKSNSRYNNVQIKVQTKNDAATFGSSYLYNRANNNVNNKNDYVDIKAFIFTDRSIYRPGQVVYFKTILTQNENEISKVVNNKTVEISLKDVNNQIVKTQTLELNDFGSVAGEFLLPNNGLTGNYKIHVKANSIITKNVRFNGAYTNIAVEEYKRPKFKTEFKLITESFKINDSIVVNGFAKAFSGANITDANVVYRVLRKTQFPSWYSWRRPYFSSESREITNGEVVTDSSGDFSIKFKAIPDKSTSEENLPIFTYQITADVTDINGETRSATTTVKVGYHSLLASISMDSNIDKNQQKTIINIETNNLNNQFTAAQGTLKIYKLQAPKAPLRNRPWQEPDYQQISKEEFKRLFPNDPYSNKEDDVANWQKGALTFSKKFNTKNSKKIKISNLKKWESGKYIALLETKDKFGKKVKDEVNFSVFSTSEKQVADNKLFVINTDKNSYKEGETVNLKIGSASKDITIIVQIEKNYKIVDTRLIHLKNTTKTVKIPVNKEDIGGFAIKYHFVNFNYFKSGSILVNVLDKPKSNIEIETNVFRDKLRPGQEETWSFTIKNDKNDKVAAELLASMYDASLDEFKTHNWYFYPVKATKKYYSYKSSNANLSFGVNNFNVTNNRNRYLNFPTIKNITYNWFGFSLNNNSWLNNSYLRTIRQKLNSKKIKITKSGSFNGTISGFITDENNEPLPGVSILNKNKTKGVNTGFEGNFTIDVKKNDIISIRYIGYQSVEVKVEDFSRLNVQLIPDLALLDEIVVTGYGTQKRKASDRTGSISVPQEEAEITTVLSGKAAGINIADDNKTIRIRGNSSLNSNEKPLIVIDGKISTLDVLESLKTENISSYQVLKDSEAVALYGSKGNNGVIIITTNAVADLSQIKARKNFKETAFFYPQLKTDKEGKVSFTFTMPEALTRWKLQLLAHTKDLKYAVKSMQTVTQKEVMVIPNAPRFLRQKDTITLSAKITNLTNNTLNGIAQLELSDAITNKKIDVLMQNIGANKNFTVAKDGNTNVSWKIFIPETVQAVQYKIVAKAGSFSDGELQVLPVLSNRKLVTETLPIWVNSNENKTFTLKKLRENNSTTLKNHKLTLEVTSNPVWYAIQSLPYLMEYPYECSEQTFSRFYANTLASFIANSNPRIQEVFNLWKSSDALLSNLEKNEELKSLIIQETPWLRDAQSESEQKKRIALLFDLNKMKNEQERAIAKLKDMQKSSGGFPWFKGGEYENNYITLHIATGFGHLEKLGVAQFNTDTKKMINAAVNYLDRQVVKKHKTLLENADKLKRESKNKSAGEKAYKNYLEKNHLDYTTIQYLYMRSFYQNLAKNTSLKEAVNYYQEQSKKYWTEFNLYAKGQIALNLFRTNEKTSAIKILNSLKENAITSDELGMYWKSNNSGYYFYQAPVETQALMVEVFSELENNTKTIDKLKVWLLKNKQTNSWKTTKATSEAIYALLLNGNDWAYNNEELVTIKIGEHKIEPTKLENAKIEAGTGYFKTSWAGKEITKEMGTVTISKKNKGIAWAGLYWQYFEDLDKISAANTPLKLSKKLFLKVNSDTGKELIEITDNSQLKVGDLITVRIELSSDRNMEFIHMKDMRAAGLEPINVISSYKYQDNLSYYESTKDAATNFFFDYLPKGVFVFEYDLRVNNAGSFSNGITTIESMYAPEFTSHSKGVRLNVK
ncbi:alpha-2-macroglobulin family protein [Polaribacter marinaquae]|uniref:MG2 domain-containing protein n=1 Tax=Polaribacter marinaquae TaxID=1642819 RepID=A0ABZ2TQQ7_9FLAO